MGLLLIAIAPAHALPRPDDTPEEVLRTEIITGARSPIDGKPISASEYAQLQAELQEPGPARPVVGRSLEKNLNLLRLRKFIKTFFPFLPVP
ncbi:MAG: glutathione S-transferase [Lyngbya sp. HA4199-MV5]|nr:glutathione S-transferase [Lyngbya sp. HA4199-MV5]